MKTGRWFRKPVGFWDRQVQGRFSAKEAPPVDGSGMALKGENEREADTSQD